MRHNIAIKGICALLIITIYPSGAIAQPPPLPTAVTREVDRDVREKAAAELEAAPPRVPKIKEEVSEKPLIEGPKFFVKKITLKGCEHVSVEHFEPIIKEYENKEISMEELKILAKKIERSYLKKGIIAACFIPPQDVKEGEIVLQVIEAKMGKLKIKQDHLYYDKKRIAYYWNIKPDNVMEYYKMVTALQIMNKNPDKIVKATLHAGEKPKTTDVLLETTTHFPIHVTASFDNAGGPSTGVFRKGIGIKHNNLLGLDDTLMLGDTFGDHFQTLYGYHSIPVTNFGTSIMYGGSRSKSFAKKDYEIWNMRSYTKGVSFFVYQDIYARDGYMGEYYMGLDAKDSTNYTKDATIGKDKFRTLRLGSKLLFRGTQSSINITQELSQGLNWLGARRMRVATSSRDAENTFSKFKLSLDYSKSVPPAFQIKVRGKLQVAGERLPSNEQAYYGGINSVRGYPDGDYAADTGFQGNIELLIPPFFLPDSIKLPYASRPLKNDLTGLIFFDYAYGLKRGSIEPEVTRRKLAGAGCGFRLYLYDQLLFRMEYGHIITPLGQLPLGQMDNQHLHVALDFQDKLPQEIERISKIMEEDNMKQWAWNILNKEINKSESHLRENLYWYYRMAEAAKKDGDLDKAKEYYAKALTIGKTSYDQTLSYVKASMKERRNLEESNRIAMRYYKEGNFEKAKKIWQRIIKDAKAKPLLLEF